MADYEAVEYKSSVLVTLSQDIPSLDHDRGDNIFHFAANKSCVHQEFVSSFRFLTKSFLPESNPQFKSKTCIELSFILCIEWESVLSQTCCEYFFYTLLVENLFVSLRILDLVIIKYLFKILNCILG